MLVAAYLDDLLKQKPSRRYKVPLTALCGLLRAGAADSTIVREAQAMLQMVQTQPAVRLKGANKDALIYALINCVKIAANREKILYENFKTYYQTKGWKNEKLYGLWGFFHVLQAGANGGKASSFVHLLLNDPNLDLENKIVSVGFLYTGCRTALPTSFLPPMMQDKGKHFTTSAQMNYDGPLTTFEYIENLKEATRPNTATLFRLNSPGSPFLDKPVKISYSNLMPASQRLQLNEPGKSMADYFQYVILLRDSPAVNTILP